MTYFLPRPRPASYKDLLKGAHQTTMTNNNQHAVPLALTFTPDTSSSIGDLVVFPREVRNKIYFNASRSTLLPWRHSSLTQHSRSSIHTIWRDGWQEITTQPHKAAIPRNAQETTRHYLFSPSASKSRWRPRRSFSKRAPSDSTSMPISCATFRLCQ